MPSSDLDQAILANDFLRYSFAGANRAGWQKEWFHFCLLSPEIDLLVNLNVSGDTRPAAPPGTLAARVVLLARTVGWQGDVETVDSRGVKLFPGQVAMSLGQNRVSFREGYFELAAALQTQSFAVDLRLKPLTVPLGVSREVPIGRGSIGWFALPRLAATGQVIVGNRVFLFQNAPAYHDHNWGRWLWGEDFSWEWGFVHFVSQDQKWTLVFDRTLNRARTKLLEATLALWREMKLVKVFSRHEITIRPLAYAAADAVVRIPRPLAMAVPELGRDVPSRLEVHAQSGSDRLSLSLTTQDEAQVLVPNETDLGTTIITEVTGEATIEGSIRGALVQGMGRGLFEFLTI